MQHCLWQSLRRQLTCLQEAALTSLGRLKPLELAAQCRSLPQQPDPEVVPHLVPLRHELRCCQQCPRRRSTQSLELLATRRSQLAAALPCASAEQLGTRLRPLPQLSCEPHSLWRSPNPLSLSPGCTEQADDCRRHRLHHHFHGIFALLQRHYG